MAGIRDAQNLQIVPHGMPHEAYIRSFGEDWSGVTNQKERKKLQNRLNQRARRMRKSQLEGQGLAVRRPDKAVFNYVTEETLNEKRAMLERFAEQALVTYATCQPTADHLLRLIQLNVINSLTRNAAMLGFKSDWLLCEAVSPFIRSLRSPDTTLPVCPVNLVPTPLQRTIPHHPWIDLFPLPRMRDNFLAAITQKLTAEEEQQLWDDLIESTGGQSWTGMIAWGEPWDPLNWEVTVPFLRRWGWLLAGCPEILQSTNCWRRQRGEGNLNLASLAKRWGEATTQFEEQGSP